VQVDVDETVSNAETKALITAAVKLLKTDPGTAAVPAPAKKETRGVHLNMDGLLGKREHEDLYIQALLQVDGVTSVTIDRVRCCSKGAAPCACRSSGFVPAAA